MVPKMVSYKGCKGIILAYVDILSLMKFYQNNLKKINDFYL